MAHKVCQFFHSFLYFYLKVISRCNQIEPRTLQLFRTIIVPSFSCVVVIHSHVFLISFWSALSISKPKMASSHCLARASRSNITWYEVCSSFFCFLASGSHPNPFVVAFDLLCHYLKVTVSEITHACIMTKNLIELLKLKNIFYRFRVP